MGIENLPAALQPIVQQGFLARKFERALQSTLGYREVADREDFPNAVGQTVTKTRRGLKAPVTTPLAVNTNTNLDNGLTASEFSVEQYTLGIAQYADTIDLNMVTSKVALASVFVQNAEVNGVQAKQSLDRLARNQLYFGSPDPSVIDVGGYMGGNTRVITTLGAPSATVHVDDIRGFANIIGALGSVTPVSAGSPSTVAINGVAYTMVGVVADGANVSTAPSGVSGTLTFSSNVAVADGTSGNPAVVSTAPLVVRPNGRKTAAALVAGDLLTMAMVLKAVSVMRNNAVPSINGFYNFYLDNDQLLGLFQDPAFQQLFRGAFDSKEYVHGSVFTLLGVRFIPVTEAPITASLGAGPISNGLLVGKGALIEGDYVSIGYSDMLPDADKSMMEMVDGICMVTREPLDRLKQIIAQSWYWIGGFALPSDITANSLIIPTASNSALKRGVLIQSLGL